MLQITNQEFHCIARENVDLFVGFLTGEIKLSTGDLTRAITAAISVSNFGKVRFILTSLLQNHPSPLVREACLISLSEDGESFHAIQKIAEMDQSEIIRDIARGILED